MSCEWSSQIHLYHDGELPVEQRAAVEAHLQSCVDCHALLTELRGLSGLFARSSMTGIEPAAMQRLRDRRYILPDTGVLRIAGWLTAAAAAVLLAALPMLHREDRANDTALVASADVLDTVAVTPPTDVENSHNDLVALAQWMSDDLTVNERQH
jgi:anti-sigma factor RsiW